MLEYLQQLWNEVLAVDTALLEDAEESQIVGSKCKEVTPGNNRDCWPSKRTKGKQLARYCRDIGIKMGMLTPVRSVCALNRTAWCTIQGE